LIPVDTTERPNAFPDDHDELSVADGGNSADVQVEDTAAVDGGRHADDAQAIDRLNGLVKYVVENLVDDPANANINVEQRGNMIAFSVRLPEEEIGKVIGRGGRIAKSIRTALMIAGSQQHLRVSLDIDASDPIDEPES
jgi:predicted RNA-binding protein YlqC (UPF0109 family)